MIGLFGWKEVVIAAYFLFGAPDDHAVPAELNTPAVRTQLQNLAVSEELLDPREVRYMLTRQEDFGADMKLLRQRHEELGDAPPIGDVSRFPELAILLLSDRGTA